MIVFYLVDSYAFIGLCVNYALRVHSLGANGTCLFSIGYVPPLFHCITAVDVEK